MWPGRSGVAYYAHQVDSVLACCTVAMLLTLARTVVEVLDIDEPILPYRHAWGGPKDVPVYEVTGDPSEVTSVRRLETGNM